MIKLYGFGPRFGVIDSSPFVLKVNCYLRMTGIEFEHIPDLANLKKSPKGKLPFIEDNGKVIADSYFIIKYLQEKYSITLDDWLTEEQKATAYLIAKSLDENLYWCIVYSRWIHQGTWPKIRESFFGGMSFPLKQLGPIIFRKGIRKALHEQGLGRHSEDEIMDIAHMSLTSLSTFLGDKPYFFGDQPCSFDVNAYAFLTEIIKIEIGNPMTEMARSFDNLVAFCQRLDDAYYGDSEKK